MLQGLLRNNTTAKAYTIYSKKCCFSLKYACKICYKITPLEAEANHITLAYYAREMSNATPLGGGTGSVFTIFS